MKTGLGEPEPCGTVSHLGRVETTEYDHSKIIEAHEFQIVIVKDK